MKEEIRTLAIYRLERAHESLEEAKLLLQSGHANTFVNRLYYACFYVVSALLFIKGLSSAKHSGVRSLFHKNCVKTGIVDAEMGHLYDMLFDNRQKGDYSDMVRFKIEDVQPWYDEAHKFVEVIENLVKKEMSTE